MDFNKMVKSRRMSKSIGKDTDFPETLDICGMTFKLRKFVCSDDYWAWEAVVYDCGDYEFQFAFEFDGIRLVRGDDEEIEVIDISPADDDIDSIVPKMEAMLSPVIKSVRKVKMKNKMKKFNDSYMGFDDIFIRNVKGEECLLYNGYFALRERVEGYLQSEVDDLNDEFSGSMELSEYIKKHHDLVTEYISIVYEEGDGCLLEYGAVYHSMLKGGHTIYVSANEKDANEVAEILRGLEDAESEDEYYLASERLQEITIDIIEEIRYDGEPEFENIDIVNNIYIPDIYW